jgi:hypothetical protein
VQKALVPTVCFAVLVINVSTSAQVISQISAETRSPAIEALLTANFPVTQFQHLYKEDGAADGSITALDKDGKLAGQPIEPDPRVATVVENGDAALPALIDCLSDVRPTQFVFEKMQVPLGFVCLDILLAVTRPKFFAMPNCSDDGLGACIKPSYYFRPDADTGAIARVQQNWLRAYGQGRVTFQYPSWWKPQAVSKR